MKSHLHPQTRHSFHSRLPLTLGHRLASVCALSLLLLLASAPLAQDINYDTAWTYVYDGGKWGTSQAAIEDKFHDVKALDDGSVVCVGETRDTTGMQSVLVMKLGATGNMVWKKVHRFATKGGGGYSIAIASNKDFLVGGYRNVDPMLMRIDSLGNMKWSTWYYDSLHSQRLLTKGTTINSIKETSRGTIICAYGYAYPEIDLPKNYAAYLEYDTLGTLKRALEWDNQTGYAIGGYYIEETRTGYYMLSGNQATFYLDSTGTVIWKKKYGFSMPGVGSVTNNVARVKMLRDGSLMVAGQAYEGNCFQKWGAYYYDAWWSPISYAWGTNAAWDTAGIEKRDENIYDFCQLNNGNLVFVGNSGRGGVWVFITDSTGKELYGQKTVSIPYLTDNGKAAYPYSVGAVGDSDFVVSGKTVCDANNGATNAFVAYFSPQMASATHLRTFINDGNKSVAYHIENNSIRFESLSPLQQLQSITLTNAAGRVIEKQSIHTRVYTMSVPVPGVYFFRVRTAEGIVDGKIVLTY